jgi:CRP-like cAMP-binding protein
MAIKLTENHFKQHLQQYIDLSNDEYEKITGHFHHCTLKKDEYLTSEHKKVQHTFWVIKGLLISCYTDEKGKEHIIQFATEGCWITDQNAFYNKQPASFNIRTLEDTELLRISFEDREQLCAEIHKMETFFRRKANDSFVKQQKRLLTYLTADAAQRYDLLMQEYPGLFQRISKKLIAQYLGVSRETLSRINYKNSLKK